MRQLQRLLPKERYLFFGDSANAPYGTRPTAQVLELTLAAVEALLPRGIKALVIACNTATAAAVDTLRQRYPELVIVGIEPALKLAAERYPGGQIGIMATEVTLRERKFLALLSRFSGDCQVIKLPVPGLVEQIEHGKANTPETEALLRYYLQSYVGKLDALVLGCTHFPFVRPALERIFGGQTALLDGGEGTARETRRRLREAGLLYAGPGELVLENSGGEEMLCLSRRLLELP